MPAASPPKRPARRRSAPGYARASFWRDMAVVNLPTGQPTIELSGGALKRFAIAHAIGHEVPDRRDN